MAIVEAAERHNHAVRHDSVQVATKGDTQPELFSGSLIATITHRDALLQRRENSLGRLRAMHWMQLSIRRAGGSRQSLLSRNIGSVFRLPLPPPQCSAYSIFRYANP